MKRLLLLAVAGIFFVSCNDSAKENEVAKNSDWVTQNLKGMVKSVEVTTYTPDSTGKISAMDSCCITTDNYDEKGYITSSAKKDSKGNASESTTMTRWDKGQMKTIANTKNGKSSGGMEIGIDKDGKYNTAYELDSAGNKTFYYTNITEDEYGAVTSGTRHKKDSSVEGMFTNVYVKGMQVGSTYDSAGKRVYTSKSELNDKGDVAKTTEISVGKDSTTTTVTTYTYDSRDEQGNWTQRTTYNEKGKATRVTKRTITYFKKD